MDFFKKKEDVKAKAERKDRLKQFSKNRELQKHKKDLEMGISTDETAAINLSKFDSNAGKSWKFWQGRIKPVVNDDKKEKFRKEQLRRKYRKKRVELGLIKEDDLSSSDSDEEVASKYVDFEYVPSTFESVGASVKRAARPLRPTKGKGCCCIAAILCLIIIVLMIAGVALSFILKHPELLAL